MVIKNHYNQYFIIFVLLFFTFISTIYAQDKIKVNASGTSVSRNLTPKEALEEAILDAQKNAYKKAGIKEHVSVSSILFTESNGEKVKNYFNEISSIESNANIVVDSVYKDKRSFDDYGNMIITVEIDATIFKYDKEKDPSFFFKISSLKDTYYENESISFSFTPSQDGYLKIFAINDSDAILLYPYKSSIADYLSDKPDSLFKKGITVRFPIHPAYEPGYSIELNTESNIEINNLIFVYSKTEVLWVEDRINLSNILKWIYKIPIDKRDVQFRSITIKPL